MKQTALEPLYVPAEVYHADYAIGSSMLETFRSSRREYYERFVARTLPPKESTPAMLLGDLVHLLVLEPDRFEHAVAEPYPELAPDGKKWLRRKGSDHERWWAEEEEARRGKIACSVETIDTAKTVAQAVRRHPVVERMLQVGVTERSLWWTDEESGLECKCRFDIVTPDGLAMDLKTTRCVAPGAYARQVMALGYHRKAAHYLDGLRRYAGAAAAFVHVAAETSYPFRVAVYAIDDFDGGGDSLGQQQRRETLRQLADCVAKDEWQEPWESHVTDLRLPGWAWSETDYQLGEDDESSD